MHKEHFLCQQSTHQNVRLDEYFEMICDLCKLVSSLGPEGSKGHRISDTLFIWTVSDKRPWWSRKRTKQETSRWYWRQTEICLPRWSWLDKHESWIWGLCCPTAWDQYHWLWQLLLVHLGRPQSVPWQKAQEGAVTSGVNCRQLSMYHRRNRPSSCTECGGQQHDLRWCLEHHSK